MLSILIGARSMSYESSSLKPSLFTLIETFVPGRPFIVFIISGKKNKISIPLSVVESKYSGARSQSPDLSESDEIILYEEDSGESNIIIQDAIPIRKRR